MSTPNRISTYSGASTPTGVRSAAQQSTQVSTTTLLNALHTSYATARPYRLDASTSLVVNTWLTATNPSIDGQQGGTVDTDLARQAWEHARRRAEDGCVVLGGLLSIPPEAGYRAFDVFYYLLTSASTPAEREFLGLKHPSAYALLNKSGTYEPPAYLPTADDIASAEDFRSSLKQIGIKGSAHRSLLSTLAGLLKLGETTGLMIDQEDLEEICEDVGGLLGLEPEVLMQRCSTDDRQVLISGIYEALVDWVLMRANSAIRVELQRIRDGEDTSESGSGRIGARTPRSDEDNNDTVNITVVEIPGQDVGKAIALRGVFDDHLGINAEMKEDGIEVTPPGSSIVKEMQNAVLDVAADMGVTAGPVAKDRMLERERREEVLEKVGAEAEAGGFLKKILYPVEGQGIIGGMKSRMDLPAVLGSSRIWYHLSLHPTDESLRSLETLASTTSAWSAGTVSKQLRTWRLPEWANYRNKSLDFTADFDIDEFSTRYSRLGCQEGRDGVESWILERGWSNGEVVVGLERVWIREGAWWEAESMLDLKSAEMSAYTQSPFDIGMETGYSNTAPGPNESGFFPPMDEEYGSRDNLLQRQQSVATMGQGAMGAKSIAPTMSRTLNTMPGDYGLGAKGDDTKGRITYYDDEIGQFIGGLDPELAEPKAIVSEPVPKSRRVWVAVVWMLTFWIPSFMLRYVGRMKRPDVRFAWREKLILCLLIFLLNATVIFWIVEFGHLLCPNLDKAWNNKEVGYHAAQNDFWVSIHGKVYDITKFAKVTHGDIQPLADQAAMMPFAGMNLDEYFPPPLSIACSYLVHSDDAPRGLLQNTTVTLPQGMHTSGPINQASNSTKLHDINWYTNRFLPKIQGYYKGDLVYTKATISSQASTRQWVILNGKIYDLTDYFYTKTTEGNIGLYSFIPDEVAQLLQQNSGSDITSMWKTDDPDYQKTLNCMDNAFYEGKPDFRDTAKCQVNNYILLAFTIVICAVILVKFLSALQFGSKRRPAAQDKFVICQVPAYTEGEDQLRKGLDSLTALQYDNKRKLICVMCDGMIVGGGNDRPTPKIVLDILGVDPKIDPPALPFKSIGSGNEQLNYGKVYSGLYEYEGNVVPYIVVVKVGKESEQTKAKPGNRGKRDSQILLLSFLNRVHHRSPMSPLELEMFHQINNIIGVDPELYEYLFMVDADTSVREDSLNRLVASCANDSKIAGICGETSLENEEHSWWTMIQVYEYYISHHLAKAFESLFGSVTCLPGCFCMYRLRTADKGRPLIISDKVINDYNSCTVDTLHKKNLFSLGEDRYLTTLMCRHFPQMSYKFVPDAYAQTAAPDTWSVLLSQRRRWINSTIHNLAELVWLKDLCGFCCFSMRFVVFIDLFGTIILPATCGYLGYLIYRVSTHTGQFPLISLILIAAVYGLQAIIFILKRQWQHIGWMLIYLLAFPIYSFVLPIYSFWNQDNFTWGNTRIVIGEKGNKQIVALEDEGFDPRNVPLQRWDDYAAANNLPGRRGIVGNTEKFYQDDYGNNNYEMDDIHSVYSSAKPASTILTGFHNAPPAYMPPQSPAAFTNPARQSTYSMSMTAYKDQPQYSRPHSRLQSLPGMADPYQDHPYQRTSNMASTDNLIAMQSPPLRQNRSPLASRPVSTIDFRGVYNGPDDSTIIEAVRTCLIEVDLDNVTKKQVRALVEQRLQTELSGEKRLFLDRQIDAELANM
ncbi:chitin synthase, partial [Lecanoromycetidae sp. Uapishka_2]